MKRHSGYKAFRKLSNFSYKRIRRVKLISNTLRNKEKRQLYLQRFLPYHRLENLQKQSIIFIDEVGFNLNNQGRKYGWAQKGRPAILKVPQKIQNTTAIVAISNRAVEAFQLFDKGTKG